MTLSPLSRNGWDAGLVFSGVMAMSAALLLIGSAGATVRDLNPDAYVDTTVWDNAGRATAVAVDPTHREHVLALADSGGVFGTTDLGAHWQSNVLSDGSPGPFGRGLEKTGLTNFQTLAIDPHNARNVLLLAEDDNRVKDSLDGIWRSTDGGATWNHATNGAPPCPVYYVTDLGGGPTPGEGHVSAQIRFSPGVSGTVYATAACRLGISTDFGASWKWVSPLGPGEPSAPLDGLDVVGGDATRPDTVLLCVGSSAGPGGHRVAFYRSDIMTFVYPGPPTDQGGSCGVAFNPYDVTDILVATGGPAGISEGQRALGEITWRDLKSPTASIGNGRPVWVLARKDGNGFRVYFHATTEVFWEQCAANAGCAAPASAAANCPLASAGSWQCLDRNHADFTDIAFDPALPAKACPLFISTDGGVARELNCGELPGGGAPTGKMSVPSNIGFHALQPRTAAFSGSGSSFRSFLALQDNGVQLGYGGTWHFLQCGDGHWFDTLAPSAALHCNTDYTYAANSDPPTAAGWGAAFTSAPPGTPMTQLFGWFGLFSSPGVFMTPVLTTKGQVQIETYPQKFSASWAAFGSASPAALGTFADACCGDFAVTGRRVGSSGPRNFLVLLPPQTSGRHPLLCFDPLANTWRFASGLTDPIRVWGSDGERNLAYAYDHGSRGLYVSRNTHDCTWKRDTTASSKMLDDGTFSAGPDHGSWRDDTPVTAVGFDPGRPGRVLVGTRHAGILITTDYGAHWAVSHAYPEPNGGIAAFYNDDSGLSTGTLEPTAAASWGRGLWAVTLSTPGIIYAGIPVRPGILDKGGILEKITCPETTPAPCNGFLKAVLTKPHPKPHGPIETQLIGRTHFHILRGHSSVIRIPITPAGRRLLRPVRVIEITAETITTKGHAFSRRTVTIKRR